MMQAMASNAACAVADTMSVFADFRLPLLSRYTGNGNAMHGGIYVNVRTRWWCVEVRRTLFSRVNLYYSCIVSHLYSFSWYRYRFADSEKAQLRFVVLQYRTHMGANVVVPDIFAMNEQFTLPLRKVEDIDFKEEVWLNKVLKLI